MEKRNAQGHGKESVAHKHSVRNHLDPSETSHQLREPGCLQLAYNDLTNVFISPLFY